MQRKIFDKLVSGGGAVVIIVLLVAGGLLTWGHSFAAGNVHDQLAQQQIYFPSKQEFKTAQRQFNSGGQKAVTDSEFPNAAVQLPALKPYVGKQVLTGRQAQVYANYWIGQHLYAMPMHGVYSQISGAAMAARPGSAQATSLNALKNTSFMGTTLRGILLTAYAFGTIATIMFWASIACWVGAAVLALLVAAGILHARRTSEEERVFAGHVVTTA